MEPTNDPEILRGYHGQCYEMCPHCQRSICTTTSHQEWTCRCGHRRLDHLDQWDYYGGPPGYKHPHPCLIQDCGCEALWYLTSADLITNEEAISGLLGVIQDLDA